MNISVFHFISQSDFIIKAIIVILAFISVWSWAIIFDKFLKLRLLNLKTEKFKKLFWSGQMLEDIYRKIKNKATHPSAALFAAAMQEWESVDVIKIAQDNDVGKKGSLKERLMNLMEVALNRAMVKLRYGLNFLFIIGSSATLIGLFGTVWGIVSSFHSMIAMKSTNMIAVAPGMSNALIATLFGLVAAVPSLIAYYVYSNKFDIFEDEMENFVCEIITILSRELDQ